MGQQRSRNDTCCRRAHQARMGMKKPVTISKKSGGHAQADQVN
jgi:hypothetical protein